jgi:SET domain-containing protein
MYKPLPDSLTIKTSKVNGLGLFAKESIPQATNLGMTHIKIGNRILRTPLGGFINHANDPNCVKVELLMTNHDDPDLKFDYKKWNLVTIKDIQQGEELTLKYTFYDL